MFNVAVFLYDIIITTGEEIRCFWGRKVTGAAILFWMNKYMTILFLAWNFGSEFAPSNEVSMCAVSAKGGVTVDAFLFLIPAAFTAIRVHALRRSFFLSSIAFAMSMVPAGVNIATFWFGVTGKIICPIGCTQFNNTSVALSKTFGIISRSCLVIAHCLAIGATWFTLVRPRDICHGVVLKRSLSSVFLTDGTVYFLTFVVLNCLQLIYTLLSPDVLALKNTSAMANFVVPLSAVLVSRFLLHLQSASLRAVGSVASSQALSAYFDGFTSFERVAGSLGASIRPEDYLAQEGEWGEGAESDVADRE
ncbi:hypothetical protein BD311DRAFT_675720 [Dichomitus squalens]|uniref:DUF6533 domain-containing protein n=1 Tax=Dichomitus squalens TaxID=114155 RepID=A0A4Q9M6U5_9APHY|nr:hypothetical protein BD311DRAFT_675720 [Dichomitus squalens]